MRIAMVARLAQAIPPRLYGGTERAISVLTEELVRREHEVTLFASGDSDTTAELVACFPRAQWQAPEADAAGVRPIRTVLASLDGSPGENAALGWATHLAPTMGARLVLVRAVGPAPDGKGSATPGAGLDRQPESERDFARACRYVDCMVHRVRLAGIQVEGRVVIGEVAGAMRAMADAEAADLMVMSARAPTAPGAAIPARATGIVEWALRAPVLFVRSDDDTWHAGHAGRDGDAHTG